MKVFLTGGTGLVGSHLALLLRARGDAVRCLQRPRSDTARLERSGCVIVEGDVRDRADVLAAGLEGCDAVVHSAALVYTDASWPRMRAVNVDGTERVLQAAATAGVERVVHVSSVVVYGDPADFAGTATLEADPGCWENLPPLPPSALYARSKREAEEVAASVTGEAGIACWILRPSGVYGEWDRGLVHTLARMLGWPWTPVVGGGGNTVPMVYAGNVAEAVVRCLDGSGPPGAYDLGEDHPTTQRQALEGLARGMCLRPRLVPVPARLAAAVAAAAEGVGRWRSGRPGPSLSRILRLATLDNPYGSRRARSELGWVPPVSANEALERTGRWLETNADDGAIP